MAFRNSGKTKLSKGILEMKFMKRSKDKAIKEMEEEEGRSIFDSQITEGMKAGIGNYILEPSYVPCENLIEGRLSFRGMNPEIERLLELEELAKRPPLDRSMKTDVSDAEMARFKNSLVETVASKYKKKKTRKSKEMSKTEEFEGSLPSTPVPPKKKAKFMRPADDS